MSNETGPGLYSRRGFLQRVIGRTSVADSGPGWLNRSGLVPLAAQEVTPNSEGNVLLYGLGDFLRAVRERGGPKAPFRGEQEIVQGYIFYRTNLFSGRMQQYVEARFFIMDRYQIPTYRIKFDASKPFAVPDLKLTYSPTEGIMAFEDITDYHPELPQTQVNFSLDQLATLQKQNDKLPANTREPNPFIYPSLFNIYYHWSEPAVPDDHNYNVLYRLGDFRKDGNQSEVSIFNIIGTYLASMNSNLEMALQQPRLGSNNHLTKPVLAGRGAAIDQPVPFDGSVVQQGERVLLTGIYLRDTFKAARIGIEKVEVRLGALRLESLDFPEKGAQLVLPREYKMIIDGQGLKDPSKPRVLTIDDIGFEGTVDLQGPNPVLQVVQPLFPFTPRIVEKAVEPLFPGIRSLMVGSMLAGGVCVGAAVLKSLLMGREAVQRERRRP